jgi:hypothetical protein
MFVMLYSVHPVMSGLFRIFLLDYFFGFFKSPFSPSKMHEKFINLKFSIDGEAPMEKPESMESSQTQ